MGELCGKPEGQTQFQCHVPPPVDAGPQLGMNCEMAGDCTVIDANARCATGASDMSFEYPAGFCTLDCQTDPNICPTGSSCIRASIDVGMGTMKSLVGQANSVCLADCNPNAASNPCAEGMTCFALDAAAGVGVCMPITPMPAGQLGQECESDTTGLKCVFPPTNGFCINPEVFPGGQCSALCNDVNNCGDNGVCLSGFFRDASVCVLACATANERSTCPTNYTCWGLESGTGGVCLPDCNANEFFACEMGEVCNATTGFCDPVDAGMMP